MDMFQAVYETGAEGGYPIPWFCFDDTNVVVASNGVRTTAVPTDFIDFDDEWPLTITDANGKVWPMQRRDYDYLIRTHLYDSDGTTLLSGMPVFWSWANDTFHWFPIPDANYNINVPCYKKTVQLSTVNSVTTPTPPWFKYFPRLIATEVALSIAMSTRDQGAVQMCMSVLQDRPGQIGLRTSYRNKVEGMRMRLREILIGTNE
jgi:hypothetical protein